MPGIFVQTVCFGAINTAVGLAEDKDQGPARAVAVAADGARGAVLGGRVLADTRAQHRDRRADGAHRAPRRLPHAHRTSLAVIGGVGVLVLFGVALASIFALIGLSVPNGEAAQAAAFPLLAPLVFASNAFVDPATMPGWLGWWAERQPVSKTTEAARGTDARRPDLRAGDGVAALVARHHRRDVTARDRPLPPGVTRAARAARRSAARGA